MSLQQQIIAELKVKPSINEEEEVRKRVDFLKTYVKNAGAKGLLIAISGGRRPPLQSRKLNARRFKVFDVVTF